MIANKVLTFTKSPLSKWFSFQTNCNSRCITLVIMAVIGDSHIVFKALMRQSFCITFYHFDSLSCYALPYVRCKLVNFYQLI